MSFSRLTALFIDFDHEILKQCSSAGENRSPDLLSPHCINVLTQLLRREASQAQNGFTQDGDAQSEQDLPILAYFQGARPRRHSPSTVVTLYRLTQVTASLIPRFPRMVDTFAGIAELASYIAHDSLIRSHNAEPHGTVQANSHLAQGYQFYKVMADTLETCIEKSVNHISPDCATRQIAALGNIMEYSLQADHPTTAAVLEEHRQKYPRIDPRCTIDVLVTHWRLKTYTKLILSSQMQLRVNAVTNMSTQLVSIWSDYKEHHEYPRCTEVIKYFTDFLLGTNLVSYILGPTCHPEITAESGNIIGFLAVTGTFSNEHTDLMWQTMTTSQDPRVVEALVRMMRAMAHLWSSDGMLNLCGKLQSVPIESFTPILRELCEIVMNRVPRHINMLPYLLMFRLLRESSAPGPPFFQEIQHFVCRWIPEMLKGPIAPNRSILYDVCLKDLAEKTPYTLGSLRGIIFLYRHHTEREVDALTKEHNLPGLVVDELEHAIASAKDRGLSCVLSGAMNSPRIELLTSIVYYQPQAITGDIGLRLWNMLVGKGAASQEDRDTAWQTLNVVFKRAQLNDCFIRTCYNDYMPNLPPECFCSGALDFVMLGILPLVNDPGSIILDDEYDTGDEAIIEQLWRMTLKAPNGTIERKAISALVKDIYIDSQSIRSFPPYRARKVHVALVGRCMSQLSSAAEKLKAFSQGNKNGDSQEMVTTPPENQIAELELLFARSLAVIREFHKVHQETSQFRHPDLRSLTLPLQHDVQGEPAGLKYQSFDGDSQTKVQDLNIGRDNTAGSLLASLQDATGFKNYRLYYKGQVLVPLQEDICKSLEDLQIHNGLILVKREADATPQSTSNIRPGASPVEIEITARFEELWQYLGLEEKLAREIYHFLVVLPVHSYVLNALREDSVSYQDIFPAGQPFKSMYAIHVLGEFLNVRQTLLKPVQGVQVDHHGLRRAMALIVSAISDREVIDRGSSTELQTSLTLRLVELLLHIVRDPSRPDSIAGCLNGTLLDRLIGILSSPLAAEATQNSAKLINTTFQAIMDICSIHSALYSYFISQVDVGALVQQLLLDDPRPAVRKTASNIIAEKTTSELSSSAIPATDFRDFFWQKLFGLVSPALRRPAACCEAFDLVRALFVAVRESASPSLNLQRTIQKCCSELLQYRTFEEITQPGVIDYAARGLISLVHCIVCSDDFPVGPELLPSKPFTSNLFWHHLFPRWWTGAEGSQQQAIILNTPVRAELNDIVLKLAGQDLSQNTQLLQDLDMLVPFAVHDADDEPYHYELPPQFERSKAVRSSCGYAGLRNLSNTCYLNSLFTQLFMNVDFRHFMLNVEIRDGDGSQNLLYHTRSLFAQLQESNRRFIDPGPCVLSIKTYDDAPIDIHNQMDVDEFYNLLFDRWEGQLLSADAKRSFRSFFGGQLVQQVKSKECEHISERTEPFSAIQCDIKGKNTLQESLQAYVDGEIMEGDNKYKCSTCDRHVDAVKRACLKDIPDSLIFHLKRFDFNLRTLQRSKINDYFAFPTRLDMKPYTILSNSPDSPEDWFELVGVLVHSGTAESGHYYSFIKERPTTREGGCWVEFNDDLVTPWSPSQMESACFGGPEARHIYDVNGIVYDKTYSAYMLFYQRASSLQMTQQELQETGQVSPIHVSMPAELENALRIENTTMLRRHCIYDPDHIRLVGAAIDQMWGLMETKCALPDHSIQTMAVQLALSHLDQVASRAKDLPDFEELLSHLQRMCAQCAKCSFSLFEYFHFGRHEAFKMLVQRNPDARVRQDTGRLLIQAIRKVKETFPDVYSVQPEDGDPPDDTVEVVCGVAKLLTVLFDGFDRNMRSWHEVFGLMLDFVKLGQAEMSAALREDLLKKVLLLISADANLVMDIQYQRMLNNLSRRMPNRAPSYENIIALMEAMVSSLTIECTPNGMIRVEEDSEARAIKMLRKPEKALAPTRDELDLLVKDWNRNAGNIFIDKLISIAQNPVSTDKIIACFLDHWNPLDPKIYKTLRFGITGLVVTHLVSPFLRVAAVYCRMSHNRELINKLIGHVATQCKDLKNAEGSSFFSFFRDVFDGPRKNSGESKLAIYLQSLRYLPTWAPSLLGTEFDSNVNDELEHLLHEKLFKHGPSPVFDESNGGLQRTQATDECARHLGTNCLIYMRERFVKSGLTVAHRTVASLQRIAKLCGKYYEDDEDKGPGSDSYKYDNLSQSAYPDAPLL